MADVTGTIAVTSATSGGGGGGAVGSGGNNNQTGSANVLNAPSGLQSIGQNISLGASYVSTNPDGSTVLSTAQGNITVQTTLPLQPGTQVQIQFQAGNPQTAVLVLLNSASSGGAAQTQINDLSQTVNENISSFEFNVLSQMFSSIPQTGLPSLQQDATIPVMMIGGTPESLADSAGASNATMLPASSLANNLEQLALGNNSFNNNEIIEQIKVLSQFGPPGAGPSEVGQLSLSGKLLTTIQQTLQQLQSQPSSLGSDGSIDALKTLLQTQQNVQPGASPIPGQLPLGFSSTDPAAAVLQPGSQLALKLLDIIQPGQPLPLPGGQSNLGQLVGQFTGQTLNGLPLVQTPQGAILLQAATDKLQPGTTLVFELPASGALTAALDAAAKAAPTEPKLQQMLQLLADTNSPVFNLLMNNMPKMNGQFPGSTLFFMQALQTGELKNWLGSRGFDALRGTGPIGAQLLEELQEEFKANAAHADATRPGEWRVMNIPYLGQNGIQNIQFGVRNHFQAIDPDEQRKFNLDKDAGRVTRFIFDVQFSEIGPMQIDGLLRPRIDYSKQLDILLRTQNMLPQDMRNNLRDLFAESTGAYGMHGMLTFQAGNQNWISLTQRGAHAAETRA